MLGDGGRVINMSSVLGRFGVPGYTAYCASKHAVIGFTRALALELVGRADHGQRDLPRLGRHRDGRAGHAGGRERDGRSRSRSSRRRRSARVPIGRMIQPDEVASLVKFLASPQAAAITGQTYNICGGQTMD